MTDAPADRPSFVTDVSDLPSSVAVVPLGTAELAVLLPLRVVTTDPAALETYMPVPVHPTVPAVEEHLAVACRPDRHRGPSSGLVCRDG